MRGPLLTLQLSLTLWLWLLLMLRLWLLLKSWLIISHKQMQTQFECVQQSPQSGVNTCPYLPYLPLPLDVLCEHLCQYFAVFFWRAFQRKALKVLQPQPSSFCLALVKCQQKQQYRALACYWHHRMRRRWSQHNNDSWASLGSAQLRWLPFKHIHVQATDKISATDMYDVMQFR